MYIYVCRYSKSLQLEAQVDKVLGYKQTAELHKRKQNKTQTAAFRKMWIALKPSGSEYSSLPVYLFQGIWSTSSFYTAMAEIKKIRASPFGLDALSQRLWVPSHVHTCTCAHHPLCDIRTYEPCVIVVTNKYSKAKSSNAD